MILGPLDTNFAQFYDFFTKRYLFAYKNTPDLDSKLEVRKRPPEGTLNRYHLCTFACKNEKWSNREMLISCSILRIGRLLFAKPLQS